MSKSGYLVDPNIRIQEFDYYPNWNIDDLPEDVRKEYREVMTIDELEIFLKKHKTLLESIRYE